MTSNVNEGTRTWYAARESVFGSSPSLGPSAQPSATIANTGATTSRKTEGSWASMAAARTLPRPGGRRAPPAAVPIHGGVARRPGHAAGRQAAVGYSHQNAPPTATTRPSAIVTVRWNLPSAYSRRPEASRSGAPSAFTTSRRIIPSLSDPMGVAAESRPAFAQRGSNPGAGSYPFAPNSTRPTLRASWYSSAPREPSRQPSQHANARTVP